MKLSSHIAIGVSDLERSLAFYRDALGMTVIRDATNEPPADSLYGPEVGSTRRREVMLRFGGNDGEGYGDRLFLAISQSDELAGNAPLHLGQIGIHHIGFWVDDIPALATRLRSAGYEPVSVKDTTGVGYGESAGQPMRAMFVKDPDGTILQFDERVGVAPDGCC
ncbi:VOC family protein [Rhodococcus pseudokoreensis]|uniref:VOC family protein n=1 Tax=Rhodococcus pseudokoreensis TaxID=2811421 RepID=A0A974ZRY9_9NOCA|nr:VOC family protein [Rhodococcus pseudokoreensis]QSE88180.1 VOC family protein [Rhodococcus pseudokoreensis]